MSKKEKGMEIFSQGYNCAQSVAGAFAEEVGKPFEEITKTVSPFGGGMGRMREVCGAVSGMFFVLGALEGYDSPNQEKKKELYATVQKLAEEFKKETGSIICSELLGLQEKQSDPTPDERNETYYKVRPCKELVGIACEILENYLSK